MGISAYKSFDLLKIRVPYVDKKKQDEISNQILSIEKKIQLEKKNKISFTNIVDEIFLKNFNLDYKKLTKLKNIDNFQANFSNYGSNQDLRFSFPFHHESKVYALRCLIKLCKTKVKNFLDIPIELGATISPSDFDKNGDTYYISMESLKNFEINTDEKQLVSKKFSENNISKSIKKNDLLMTRSGVAIGKFALSKNNLSRIFSDFTMRIRLKNYNPEFAYYYFRTSFFQHLIHSDKKGLQNKNIFPIQIKEFPLPDFDLNKQKKIVDQISNELKNQDEVINTINILRKRINDLITSSLK